MVKKRKLTWSVVMAGAVGVLEGVQLPLLLPCGVVACSVLRPFVVLAVSWEGGAMHARKAHVHVCKMRACMQGAFTWDPRGCVGVGNSCQR